MKVFVTVSSAQLSDTHMPRFAHFAEQDRFGIHQQVGNPGEADIILFVDAHQHGTDISLRVLRRHPLVVSVSEQTFVYNELDQPWCVLPGLYVSMPKSAFNPQRQRACSYVFHDLNPYVGKVESNVTPDLLFSFMGRRCYPVRKTLLEIVDDRAYIQDTTHYNFFGGTPSQDKEAQQRFYSEIMKRSKFVLCPRGSGPASFRLFETMAAGRVPVIFSDEWVPPVGPDWNACALFVPEANATDVSAIIRANEDRYDEMVQAARCEWEQWFAPNVLFHRMIESCRDIMQQRSIPEKNWQHRWDKRYMRLRLRELKSKIVSSQRR